MKPNLKTIARTASPPPEEVTTNAHAMSQAFAHAAEVVAKVVEGTNLNDALQSLRVNERALRAAIQDFSYNALRAWGSVDVIVSKLVDKPIKDPKVRGLLLTAISELRSRPGSAHTIVHQAVEAASLAGHPGARGLINAVLRAYQRRASELEQAVQSTETGQYAHPQWWIDALRSAYPNQWQEILRAANLHPPMTLRVNRRRQTVEDCLNRFAAAGIGARALGGSAVLLDRPLRVTSIPGFADGDVSVQDAAAQQAAQLLDVRDGMRVLDACAAPGGKTGHILEIADCSLVAMDISPERVRRIAENMQRLKLHVELRVGDCLNPAQAFAPGTLFDRILLDAPCTASGVVRRHPDIRWLRRKSDVHSFAKTQRLMLDALWPLVRRGGKLLYTSCSVFPEENSMQIQEFLKHHADATLQSIPDIPGGQLLPNAEADGFFYALLIRQ